MGTIRTRYMSGEDERQYMIGEDYEIYEKRGAPTGAVRLHYHDFYEVIYVMEGEFSSLVDNRTYNLKRGDFLLIGRNVMHNYHYVEGKHENSRRIVLWISEGMLEGLSLIHILRQRLGNKKWKWKKIMKKTGCVCLLSSQAM